MRTSFLVGAGLAGHMDRAILIGIGRFVRF